MGLYKYEHLPLLAKYILNDHVHEFAQQQLKFARQYNVPLLKFLKNLSDAQLIEISKKSVAEILDSLANNNAFEHIQNSTKKWVSDQLEVVGKYDVAAEDITLLNYVRGKSLKNFAYEFYDDIIKRRQLLDEIDKFLLASTTTAANTYIALLKDQIQEEEEFRSKLSSALPGFIYVYDVNQKVQTYSNDKLSELLGYTREQLHQISTNFYESITHRADWQNALDCRESYFKNNTSICSFECRVKDIDDNYKWMRFYETTLRMNSYGEVKEVIGVAFDVSGEKEVTHALAVRETQLLEAQEIAHIGSFDWDITGKKIHDKYA